MCVLKHKEDEYEDDHGDNVVEHPGPTFSPVVEIEERVIPDDVATVSSDDTFNPEEDVIQTTTYPVFDEPLTSTTTQSATVPPTSTTPSTTTPTTTELTSTTTKFTTAATTTATSTSTTESTSTTTGNSNNAPFLPPHQRPVRSDLASMPTPKGREILLGNVTIYESPVTNDTYEGVMLISVHDIFGFHSHVKYISDRLSDFGFRTVIPDFFHGKPVATENFPPPK